MKLTMIHGQAHRGSTCMVARELAEKIQKGMQEQAAITEFFLPEDFDKPCCGCYTCFQTSLEHCPHFQKLTPLADALLEADVIILDSPVYVYHATGQMMSLLDHFGTWWVVHRPRPEMSRKQAVVISTAAGGGMKSTNQDMADSLEMWGVHKVYRMGLGVQSTKPQEIPEGILRRIHKKTDRLSARICRQHGTQGYNTRAKKWFYLMRLAHNHFPPAEPDWGYWERNGWHKNKRPWQ